MTESRQRALDSRCTRKRALCAIAAAAAIMAGRCAHAEQAGRTELPCLDGVCVGDDLRKLLDLPWHDVVLPAAGAADPRAAARMAAALLAEQVIVAHVLRHWPNRSFDGPALRALASLDAVCEDFGVWLRPRAAFTSSAGWRVVVTFAPIEGGEHGPQPFEVATLAVEADGAAAESLPRELTSRYEGYATYPTYAKPGVRWLADAGAISLKLFAPIRDSVEHAEKLNHQPGCASSAPPVASQRWSQGQ